MKKQVFTFIVVCAALISHSGEALAKEFKLYSPDSLLALNVKVEKDISWTVSYKDKVVLENCPVSLALLNGKVLGDNPEVISDNIKSINETINPVVPTKRAVVHDVCNELTLSFKGNYSIMFRAYAQGIAYRFVTSLKGDIEVKSEQLNINFGDGDVKTYFPEIPRFYSHFECDYPIYNLADIESSRFCVLPVLFKNKDSVNVLVTEADLYDYPNMFLYGQGNNSLEAGFPKYVLETEPSKKNTDRDEVITKEADYIAKVSGKRSFPWRLFYITDDYAKILENDLVFQLSTPLKIKNPDWIKPGKVAWDWWNANNIYGVDFRAGINNETYKYYIDFASKYGLEYMMLDEGWSKSTHDISSGNLEINVPELVKYGKERNVDVLLWMLWKPLDENMDDILDTYKSWGVKGIKVDFMQRADQYVVKYYERVAEAAAKRQLLVDFHGAFKPVGLSRAYPNVVNYEGVKGLEHNKFHWTKGLSAEYDVTMPFIRMVAGHIDYTPGAMDNAQPKDFRIRFETPMSRGTRCHQLAMYAIYEAPLQMLADNPSNYYKENECTEFISKMPVTWDDTKVLHEKIGDYLVMARKNGDNWYIGALTDENPREFDIDFSFLSDGEYEIEIMQDGINADRNAVDYKKVISKVNNKTNMPIKLAPGGGWAAIIRK